MTTPALTYLGVYVQKVSSGVRPVQAASTSTEAVVGITEMGPDTAAHPVTSRVRAPSTGRISLANSEISR